MEEPSGVKEGEGEYVGKRGGLENGVLMYMKLWIWLDGVVVVKLSSSF